MDPDAALAELRTLTERCLATGYDDPVPSTWIADAVAALERVEALDGWLCRGGVLPDRWAR